MDDTKFLDLIQSTTLVGVLPLPHSIVVRRYVQNAYTNLWFTTYRWGVVFLRNQTLTLMDASKVRMFVVTMSDVLS